MLKALELVGFKSFADKTRFEFPPGISVVVGPNGSGKSNIVDAIKWVLGEQSVKTLRGKEMADVIFNGSATRRPLNSAEATITFDNSRRLLPIDAAEVHVTRRVYRNGEGEYLINRQPCRLRDIRELFWGTGVATEAYSVIEQGKVDILLQSSPRDRRLIFEEAAGISRFKIKKIESMRRLERVEQNLLRLSDIVSEVDSRLRSVRLQAAKARRYKEHADRLQELRTQVGLADWRTLSEKLAAIEAEATAIQQEIGGAAAQAEVMETRALELDAAIAEVDQAIRTSDARITANRERIAALEAAIEHQRAHGRELEDESLRHRRQVSAMNVRVGDLAQQLRDTDSEVTAAETRHRDARSKLADDERALTQLTAELDQIRDASEQRRAAHMERMRAAAAVANETGSLESQVEAAQAARARCDRRLSELTASRDVLAQELEQLRAKQQQLSETVDDRATQLQTGQTQLTETRRQLTTRQKELSEWGQRHAAAGERTRVLEELERRLEGIGSGVKDVLNRAKAVSGGPLRHVRGLVADLFHVGVETAPLVEVALGEKAQYLVAAAHRDLHDFLAAEAPRLSGRVGVIWLDNSRGTTDEGPDLNGQAGVVGRADRFVETSSEFAPLARRLLARTWIVEKLAHAAALAEKTAGAGLNFVTLAGEHLTAEGTLAVGPRHLSTGLISRRSELRALKQQISDIQGKIQSHEENVASIERQLAEQDAELLEKAAAHRQAAEILAEHRLRVGAAEQRRTQVEDEAAALETETVQTDQRLAKASEALAEVQSRLAPIEAALAELQSKIDGDARRLSELDARRQKLVRETTAAQVELAKSEQRLADLRALKRQYERDQQERHKAVSDQEQQLAQCLTKVADTQRDVLSAESEIAELYLRKESFAGETVALVNQREAHRQERAAQSQGAQRIRSKLRKLEERLHAKELAAGEVRHERTGLADRLREDYGIELAELTHEPNAQELQAREAVEQEIAELRRKLTNIGGVNLDSLEEADELEKRFESLSTQFKDLTAAKTSLEQIIGKINTDSRRLFAETLEMVREHFQGLFRKLFGGGQADIVLDEGVDILDSGIEIVARPPGKELRNISLMSGGEKTLTCVALLLAIFHSRPSPFCVLDEVDAALDEANIERFIGVLKEFLTWTQFIVVTHSKKTMTCANTLYGVTMQESGVSKRVSVRFEDVSDNGEIKPSAAGDAA